MKKISIILLIISAIFVSCNKKGADVKFNENKKNILKENGFENGVIYRYYTLIDSL